MKNNNYLKKFYHGLVVVIFILCSGSSFAQITVVIGDNDGFNSTTTYPCPIQDFYYATRAQFLYTAAELAAVGVTPGGNIDSIGWIVQSTVFTGHLQEGYTISLLNTSVTTLNIGTWEAGATSVYGPINYSYPSGFAGNVMFATTPFTYSGGNLIVEVCGGLSTGSYVSNPQCQWSIALPFNGSHQWHQDVANGCGTPDVTNYATATNRPRLVMTYTCPPGIVTADFSTSNNNPPLNVPVDFTDLSSSNAIGWQWDFGDGDTSLEQNPSHAYAAAGTYYVSLNALGCSSSDMAYDTIVVQGSPIINISPSSLSASLPCGDSISFQVTISNTGTGDLVYNTSGSGNTNIRVLATKYGTDLFGEYPATLAAINQYFTNYTLTETTTSDPTTLSNLLVQNNVFLIPEQESGTPAVFNSWAFAMNNFLLGGGTIIQCGANGMTNMDTVLTTTGLWSGQFAVDASIGGNSVIVDSTNHPITQGLSSTSILAPTATYVMNFTNPDKHKLVSYQGNDVVSFRNVGGGKVIFLAFDYYGSNNDSKKMIANAVEWGGATGLPSWVSMSQNSDTVAGSDSSVITVTFHATGIPAGTYYGSIGVNSNDPNAPYLTIPCTLTVGGDPIIAMSDTCVDFGTIIENTTAQQTFNIINDGCDSLLISSITPSLPEYTISSGVSFILPGASAQVTVTFSPISVGTFNGSILIQNNDNDTTICLLGSAGPAPVINTVSSTSQQIFECDGIATSSFAINNTGGSDLNYNITGTPSWAGLSSSTGSVIAGDSAVIIVTYDAAGLNDGSYSGSLNINTNDPLTPLVVVSISLSVDGDPEVSMSDSCVDFGGIFEGATLNQNFTIINTGCDTLSVTNFVPSLPEYTVSAPPGDILPGGSAVVTVTFNPLIAGIYNGSILIQNTDVDTTICLLGEGLVAPHINTNASTGVSQTVPACNGTDSTTFQIWNSGGSDLNFNITGIPAWASLSVTAGTVAAGDTLTITVVMSSNLLPAGNQAATIAINSNDPVSPVVNSQVTMTVLSNPCFTITGSIDACTGIGTFNNTPIVNPPTTWTWYFGDGDSSTSAAPIHQFDTVAGTILNVMAIGCTAGGCDTEYVSLTMPLVTGPEAALCLPQTQDPGTAATLGIGIIDVDFVNIHNTSNNSIDGYSNFTCADTTSLAPGDSYYISIITGQTYEETVKAWIDYNNDGAFDPAEIAFQDSAILYTHIGVVTVPTSASIFNTALRMRIESEYSGATVQPNGCSDMLYGQCEDYTVFINPNVVLSIVQPEPSAGMSIYPNPFNTETTIEYYLDGTKQVTVEVYNAIGEMVTRFAHGETQGAGTHQYHFSNPSPGIYFVKMQVNEETKIEMLVNMQ